MLRVARYSRCALAADCPTDLAEACERRGLFVVGRVVPRVRRPRRFGEGGIHCSGGFPYLHAAGAWWDVGLTERRDREDTESYEPTEWREERRCDRVRVRNTCRAVAALMGCMIHRTPHQVTPLTLQRTSTHARGCQTSPRDSTMAHTVTSGPAGTITTPASVRPTEKPRCKCGHVAKRLTSQSERNPGRVFYQCYRGRDDVTNCKFFRTFLSSISQFTFR